MKADCDRLRFCRRGLIAAAAWGAGSGRRRCRRLGCGRLGVSGRLLLVLGFEKPQPRDVLLVLLVAFGERMAAGAVGDEIELARARRTGCGLERGAAWVGDRPRRQ